MSVIDFWQFTYERQAIWRRRVELEPPPWTTDPILQEYWFVNVHRELDTGTGVLMSQVQARPASLEALVFNTMLYRVFNNYRMWLALDPFCLTGADVDAAFERIREYWKSGSTIFTAAWTISPLPYKGDDRLEKVRTGMDMWDVYQITRELYTAQSLTRAFKTLTAQKLMGHFTAYQVALDMSYIMPGFTDDEQLPKLHSGTAKSAGRTPSGSADALKWIGTTMDELHDTQEEVLSSLGLNWADVAWSQKPRLTMADIEHTLCEYMKYENIKAGHIKARRKYATA